MGLESMISSVATTEGLIADDDGSSLIDFDKKTTDTRFLENEFYCFLPVEPVQDSSKVSSISLNLCIVLLLLQLLLSLLQVFWGTLAVATVLMTCNNTIHTIMIFRVLIKHYH